MSVKSRISKLEARKGSKKMTAIIHLPKDMTDEDEMREVVAHLTANISEPFDEWIVHDNGATEPTIGVVDLDELLADIAADSKRIGVDA